MTTSKSFSNEASERYARALFEVADENSEIDKIEINLNDFLSIYNSSLEFKNFIKNPTQTIENQFNHYQFLQKYQKIQIYQFPKALKTWV